MLTCFCSRLHLLHPPFGERAMPLAVSKSSSSFVVQHSSSFVSFVLVGGFEPPLIPDSEASPFGGFGLFACSCQIFMLSRATYICECYPANQAACRVTTVASVPKFHPDSHTRGCGIDISTSSCNASRFSGVLVPKCQRTISPFIVCGRWRTRTACSSKAFWGKPLNVGLREHPLIPSCRFASCYSGFSFRLPLQCSGWSLHQLPQLSLLNHAVNFMGWICPPR